MPPMPKRILSIASNVRKGLDDDTYRATIYSFTNGRTDSSKFMYRYEAAELISKWLDPEGLKVEDQKNKRKLSKTSLACIYSIGILNKDYSSDDPYEIEMNKQRSLPSSKSGELSEGDKQTESGGVKRDSSKAVTTIKKKEGK